VTQEHLALIQSIQALGEWHTKEGNALMKSAGVEQGSKPSDLTPLQSAYVEQAGVHFIAAGKIKALLKGKI
jgi:hypothetical protein